ncbi:MAG TPA: hypothetical protein VGF29_05855 [Hyphomicrobiaceae bacterium]
MTPTRIEKLTPEQADGLIVFREAERRLALSVDPIDHDRARASVRTLYAAAGQPEPRVVFVFTSPMLCLLARAVLRTALPRDQLRVQLRDQLMDQLGAQLGVQLRDQLGGQLVGQLRDQLRDQLEAQLGDQLHEWDGLWFSGGWDAFWLAFYEFGRRSGVRYAQRTQERFVAYQRYSRECGVAFLYAGAAFVSDRPERMSFDAARRLHAIDGPALRYRDGYSLYAWKGQRIPAEYIEQRATRSAADVLNEQNAEMRRILMEIYVDVHGPRAMLAAMDAKLIAEDTEHGRPRRLYDIRGHRYLAVVNGSLEPDGSRREFLLGAHPEAATPHEAVAASYARPAGRFREAVRT